MTLQPTSIDELRRLIVATPHVRVRGGGTKPGQSLPREGETAIDLSALSGVVEHTPEECTFTALAGTRVAEIERLLAPHGQYLPFDPPLAAAGATIGGTAASGVNGSCRYRYGGLRDFLIGARIVDGRGGLITSGGKVVKNAAGFLLHQAMVGSAGRLGVFAELTFKVFPRAQAYATVRGSASDLETALGALASARAARFDLEAADIEAPSTVWLRLGGFAQALPSRIASLRQRIGMASEVLEGEEDEMVWRNAREFAWAPPDAPVVRVPLTTAGVVRLDTLLAQRGAARRYAVGGNVALVAWLGALDDLSRGLEAIGLSGQVLIGPAGQPRIGAIAVNEFGRRVGAVMDPDGRFDTQR